MSDNEAYEDSLRRQIAALEAENYRLAAELDTARENIPVVAANMAAMSKEVTAVVSSVKTDVGTVDDNVAEVENALSELTRRYFVYKNLSSATKNLTQLTDEYYTRFGSYNRLRRIAIGYVIGLDSTVVDNESLRKEVEKIYLQNTDYWLAYAIAAVMLWASDEKEAAGRAVRKSLTMDACRADVFYLLINLRFERLQPARKWYLDYLDKIDLMALGSEYQYLLQAYLSGVFGADTAFESMVSDNIRRQLLRADALTADFAGRFTERARQYADTYLHTTEHEFPTLQEVSPMYGELKTLLSKAECCDIFTADYAALAHREDERSADQTQRIEKVLYDLIDSYEDAEFVNIKDQKYNSAIVEARGDLAAAQRRYDLLYADLGKKHSLPDLLMSWAFSDDPTVTNLTVRRFSVTLMQKAIARGLEQFAEGYRSREPAAIRVNIDGFELDVSENDLPQKSAVLAEMYRKSRAGEALKDKGVIACGIVIAVCVLLLIITACKFNFTTLTIGVLGAAAGGLVLWRRIVEVGRNLAEKTRRGLQKLQTAVQELARWRGLFREEDSHAGNMSAALAQFK